MAALRRAAGERAAPSRPDVARRTLAAVRIVNGTVALVAPSLLLRRLGAEPLTSPVATYAFRMFGVRTILIGADLLTAEGEARERAVRRALIIHASDTVSAATLGLQRRLPPRIAVPLTAISAANVVLSVMARPRRPGRNR